MTDMNEAKSIESVLKKRGAGKTAGIIACVLAVLGILTVGVIFVPLAVVVAVFGSVTAIVNKNAAGIGICVLSWVLILVGFITSPVLIATLGFSIAS